MVWPGRIAGKVTQGSRPFSWLDIDGFAVASAQSLTGLEAANVPESARGYHAQMHLFM